MSSISIESATRQYGGATQAETIRNMADATHCYRIYMYTSTYSNGDAPTDYKEFYSRDPAEEAHQLNSPYIRNVVLVFDRSLDPPQGRVINIGE